MYSLLLEVQDFEKRFVQAPEEDRESLLEQHKANTAQLCNSLREKEWDDRYVKRVHLGAAATSDCSTQLLLCTKLQQSKIINIFFPFFFHFVRVSDEQCVMIMSVRKGKRLISRLLSFLPPPQATAVVMAIARNFPALAKKDKQDQVIMNMY